MPPDNEADSPSLPWLPPRPVDSHKGHFGSAMLIGGSLRMSGAISLAGMAALRSGVGRVTLGIPEVCLPTVASYEPSYMTFPLPCDEQGQLSVASKDQVALRAERMTCLACGPGMGRSPQMTDLVTWMYEVLPVPIVFDADALIALSERIDRLDEPAGPRILTPHPGEFRGFVGDALLPQEHYEQLATHMAATRGLVIVLKGNRSLITDGQRNIRNTSGNPGMATGGSGDVLTGVIAAMVCLGLPAFEAAQLAVHVHGVAGDLAAERMGQTSMIASDLIDFLPAAFLTLEA